MTVDTGAFSEFLMFRGIDGFQLSAVIRRVFVDFLLAIYAILG